MANKYRVKLGYYGYTFDDRSTALDFADMAVEAAEEERSVSIEVIKEKEEEEEVQDDEA